MNYEDFKKKIFKEKPEVKKEYDALEEEYQEKKKEIEKNISSSDK